MREYWLTKLPHAHANTLYVAHRARVAGGQDMSDATLLAELWKVLLTADKADEGHKDVDHEAVVTLEQDMFENSKRAGIAGNQQWGLDAGDHQDRWGVYSGLPQSWTPGDRQEGDDEHEVRQIGHPGKSSIDTFCSTARPSSTSHSLKSKKRRGHTLSLDRLSEMTTNKSDYSKY